MWDNVVYGILKSGYCPSILVEIREILWLAKQLLWNFCVDCIHRDACTEIDEIIHVNGVNPVTITINFDRASKHIHFS